MSFLRTDYLTNILIMGAGGHAKVVLDILRFSLHDVVGVVDDDPSKAGISVGYSTVIGDSDALERLFRERNLSGAIVAIGNNKTRVAKARMLENLGYRLITAIHPSAVCGDRVVVGKGTVVMGGVVINCDTTIGDNAIINTGATVDHDCCIFDGCSVAPGAHIAGNVEVDELAQIGIGASVVPNVRIGAGSIVGAGAVVLRDIPPNEVWVGNPAKRVRPVANPT